MSKKQELRKIAREIREIKRELTAGSTRTGSILRDPLYKKWVQRDQKILKDYISELMEECMELDECEDIDGDMIADGHGIAAEDDRLLSKIEDQLIEIYGEDEWLEVKDEYVDAMDYDSIADSTLVIYMSGN